jgi:hypothetical protein
VPVTVAAAPVTQPGDTQFDANARLVWLQCREFQSAAGAPGVRGSAAKMLFRMSMTPAGSAGGQSYPPQVVLKTWKPGRSARFATTRTVLW